MNGQFNFLNNLHIQEQLRERKNLPLLQHYSMLLLLDSRKEMILRLKRVVQSEPKLLWMELLDKQILCFFIDVYILSRSLKVIMNQMAMRALRITKTWFEFSHDFSCQIKPYLVVSLLHSFCHRDQYDKNLASALKSLSDGKSYAVLGEVRHSNLACY